MNKRFKESVEDWKWWYENNEPIFGIGLIFTVCLGVWLYAMSGSWAHAAQVNMTATPHELSSPPELPINQVQKFNREAHEAVEQIIPSKKSKIETCIWEGQLAYSIQYIRVIDGDSEELYHYKIDLWWSDVPHLRDILHLMGSKIYEIAPLDSTPQEVGTKWTLSCFNGYSAIKIMDDKRNKLNEVE